MPQSTIRSRYFGVFVRETRRTFPVKALITYSKQNTIATVLERADPSSRILAVGLVVSLGIHAGLSSAAWLTARHHAPTIPSSADAQQPRTPSLPTPSAQPPPKPPEVRLGRQDSPSTTSIAWLGYSAPTEHLAPQGQVDQSAMSPAAPGPTDPLVAAAEPTPAPPVTPLDNSPPPPAQATAAPEPTTPTATASTEVQPSDAASAPERPAQPQSPASSATETLRNAIATARTFLDRAQALAAAQPRQPQTVAESPPPQPTSQAAAPKPEPTPPATAAPIAAGAAGFPGNPADKEADRKSVV